MTEDLIGTVTHYFGKPGVAGVEITDGRLDVGDQIHVLGHTSDFTQTVESMQIEREPVQSVAAGDQVGIKLGERARVGDQVYRVTGTAEE